MGDRALNVKYPGGLSDQRRRLEEEGLEVVNRGGRLFVLYYEQFLAALR